MRCEHSFLETSTTSRLGRSLHHTRDWQKTLGVVIHLAKRRNLFEVPKPGWDHQVRSVQSGLEKQGEMTMGWGLPGILGYLPTPTVAPTRQIPRTLAALEPEAKILDVGAGGRR